MRRIPTFVLLALVLLAAFAAVVSARHSESWGRDVAIFNPNPSHLWNRVYAVLRVRHDRRGKLIGDDSLDPPLWAESEHLLSEPSHQFAMQVLDEFLRTHGESLIRDPVKRAVFQHDLWAVFDWSVAQFPRSDRPSYDRQKQELQVRLAEAMRRLALTPDEIKELPSNYAQAVASGAFAKQYDPEHPQQPFLPPDLFDPRGPWVCIQPSPESDSGVAKMHIFNFSGRSGFFVFVRLPEGRKTTMDYFQALWNFPRPWVPGPNIAADQSIENPDLPSFPAGTEVALVRRMTLFDRQGSLTTSSITESVQLRVYRAITTTEERNFGNGNLATVVKNSGQDFFEFKLSRPLLFSGKNGGLRAVGPEETEFSVFQSKGDDPIEGIRGNSKPAADKPLPELQTCVWCHSGGGVRSLNSRDSLLKPSRMQQEPQNPEYGPIYWGDAAAIEWKQNHFDWGLLNGYWKATAAPR